MYIRSPRPRQLVSQILALAGTTPQLAGAAARATGLSRVATSRRIKRLADSGYLTRHGIGTRQTYSPGAHRFWTMTPSV
jgi:DNA-binding Lrp family transcriptional regulator